MASLAQRCVDLLKNWANAVDELFTNPVISPAQAGAVIAETSEKVLKEPSVRERIGAFVRNSYLSALSTQSINFVSQTAQLALAPVTRALAGRPSEGLAMLRGIGEGFTEAFPRFMAGLL